MDTRETEKLESVIVRKRFGVHGISNPKENTKVLVGPKSRLAFPPLHLVKRVKTSYEKVSRAHLTSFVPPPKDLFVYKGYLLKELKLVPPIKKESVIMSETFKIGNNELDSHSLNGSIPAEIAENLKEFFPEHRDLSIEEVLLQQKSAYEYIQSIGKNKDNTSDSGQTSNRSQSPVQGGESSRGRGVESQLALDEALAKTLQEWGEYFEELPATGHSGRVAESRQSTPREAPVRAISQSMREDDIDPDNMTYEELQSLSEAVGHECKGLPDDLISRLPTFKYKTGLFFKKQKTEECVICRTEYRGGVQLTTLPCAHQYHSNCIKRWLKLNKSCPVCQEEVRDN